MITFITRIPLKSLLLTSYFNSKSKPEILQSKEVQDELKRIPFTPKPSESRERPPIPVIVRKRLRSGQKILGKELRYMAEHPEDMEWLKTKVRPRFWSSFLDQMDNIEEKEAEEKKIAEEQKNIREEEKKIAEARLRETHG